MGVVITVLGYLKTGFIFLLTPPMLYVTLAVAALFGAYQYHVHTLAAATTTAYAKGVSDTTKVYEKQRAAELARAVIETAKQKAAQELIVADLKAKLDAAEKKPAVIKTITVRVKDYVSEKADAACVIPVGFVRVTNAAITSTATASTVALGGRPDDDAPAGLALSEVAATVADNYAECEVRKEVVDIWQDWYKRNKALWEQTVKAQQQPVSVTN